MRAFRIFLYAEIAIHIHITYEEKNKENECFTEALVAATL
jgi:hypothetical protein